MTGAGGFLGRSVVAAALREGHQVVALVRPESVARLSFAAGVTVLAGDLEAPGAWCAGLDDVDAVVHCAAVFGYLPSSTEATVRATGQLLAALPPGLRRLVHVSSLIVYDFDAPPLGGALDEDTPLETTPARRDAYTRTKLLQERDVQDYAARTGAELVIVRPGPIYGPGNTWRGGAAWRVGPIDPIVAPLARMRLIHVENCADAIVAALTTPIAGPLIVNLVDAEQPSHWRFHRLVRRAGVAVGFPLPVPYCAMVALGTLARLMIALIGRKRLRLPDKLDPVTLRLWWRPMHYPNTRARTTLGWTQRMSLAAGIATLGDKHSR